jgi:hypothetical protein
MHIAKDFNTNMFSVPQLTKTSCGKMVCPDGAGRIVAAILNSVQLIPAQQLSKSNPNQSDDDFQAELFLSQDENAAIVTGWQYHRVAHTIGIPTNKSNCFSTSSRNGSGRYFKRRPSPKYLYFFNGICTQING